MVVHACIIYCMATNNCIIMSLVIVLMGIVNNKHIHIVMVM